MADTHFNRTGAPLAPGHLAARTGCLPPSHGRGYSVALVVDDGSNDSDIPEILRSEGGEVAICATIEELGRVAGGTHAAVIVALRLDRSGVVGRIAALSAVCGGLPRVLVTSEAPESLRLLTQVSVSEVVFVSEKHRLRDVVKRATARALFNFVDAAVRRHGNLPAQVRAALLFMAAATPPDEPLAIGEPHAFIHTVGELARRRGLSPDYLRRACKAGGVDLRRFVRWCLALRALELRQREGLTWEHTAWRMGFASTSGLSEHLQHTLGLRPRDLLDTDPHALMAQFEIECLGGFRAGAAGEGFS